MSYFYVSLLSCKFFKTKKNPSLPAGVTVIRYKKAFICKRSFSKGWIKRNAEDKKTCVVSVIIKPKQMLSEVQSGLNTNASCGSIDKEREGKKL